MESNLKITLLQIVWTAWTILDHHLSAASHRRNNPTAPKSQVITRRGTIIDMEKVHFDATWFSDYPSSQMLNFFHHSSRNYIDITRALEELQPTDIEMTFMLAQVSFEYAGKRCQGEILKWTEHFQHLLANDLHEYYVNEMKMDKYFDRLAKLMKVNNAIQKKIWEKRPRMELAKVFNLIKLDFSHPEMFKDSGYN